MGSAASSLAAVDLPSHLLQAAAPVAGTLALSSSDELANLVAKRADLEGRSADFASLLSAGIKEDAKQHADKHQTVARSLQALAATLAPPSLAASTVDAKLPALAAAHIACQQERRNADVPAVTLPVAASASADARDGRLRELVLDTLASFVRAAEKFPESVHAGAAAEACAELCELLEGFQPAAMFEDWSPAPLPAERPVAVDALRACASSAGEDAGKALEAGARLDAVVHPAAAAAFSSADAAPPLVAFRDGWKAASASAETLVWGLTLPAPTAVTSLKIYWMGGAPKSFSVETTSDALPDPWAFATKVPCVLPALLLGGGDEPTAAFPLAHPDLVMLSGADATEARALAQSIVLTTPAAADVGGRGVRSGVKVPARLLPVDATPVAEDAAAAAAAGAGAGGVPCGVTWRCVARVAAVSADACGGSEATDGYGPGSPPACVSHVVVGAHANGRTDAVTAVRIVLKGGAHAANARGAVGIGALRVMAADPAAVHSPPAAVLRRIQDWAAAVGRSVGPAAAGAEGPEAAAAAQEALQLSQAVSLRLAVASGSQAALLRYVSALLLPPPPPPGGEGNAAASPAAAASAAWGNAPLGAVQAAKLAEALATLRAAFPAAQARFARLAAPFLSAGASASGGAVSLRFDPASSGPTPSSTFSFSDNNTVVRSTGSSNCMAPCDTGFSEGVVSWSFKLEEEIAGDQCTCLGWCVKPLSGWGYDGPSAHTIRCYNGEVYGTLAVDGVHLGDVKPKAVVRFEFDADAGTIAVWINERSHGVVWKGIRGLTVYPAVGFYNSNRKVSIVACEVLSGPPPAGAAVSGGTAAAGSGSALSEYSLEDLARALRPEPAAAALHAAAPATRLAAAGAVLSHVLDLAAAYSPFLYLDAAAEGKAAATAAGNGAAAAAVGGGGGRNAAETAAVAAKGKDRKGGRGKKGGAEDRAAAAAAAAAADAADKKSAAAAAPDTAASGAPVFAMLPAVASQAQAIAVEEPFALQADGETFLLLTGLLQTFAAALKAEGKAEGAAAASPLPHLVVAVLRLLRANFARLVAAHVDLAEAGIAVGGDAPTLHGLHTTLQELLSSSSCGGGFPRAVQAEAVRVIDTGLPVLYATAATRAELLLSLIRGQQRGAGTGGVSHAHGELLVRCLRYFSSPRGVISLLPSRAAAAAGASAADRAAQVHEVSELLSALFAVLGAATTSLLPDDGDAEAAAAAASAAGSGTAAAVAAAAAGEREAQAKALLQHGAALLAAYQRHLLSLVAEEVEAADAAARAGRLGDASASASATGSGGAPLQLSANAIELAARDPALLDLKLAGGKWLAPASALPSPAVQVLLQFARLLVNTCGRILDRASAAVAAQAAAAQAAAGGGSLAALLPARLRRLDVDALVRGSVVGALLPAFAAAAAHLAAEPCLATPLLPLLTAAARRVDAFGVASLRLRSAVQRAAAVEQSRALVAADRASSALGAAGVAGVAGQLLRLQALVAADGTLTPPPPPTHSGGGSALSAPAAVAAAAGAKKGGQKKGSKKGEAAAGGETLSWALFSGNLAVGRHACNAHLWVSTTRGAAVSAAELAAASAAGGTPPPAASSSSTAASSGAASEGAAAAAAATAKPKDGAAADKLVEGDTGTPAAGSVAGSTKGSDAEEEEETSDASSDDEKEEEKSVSESDSDAGSVSSSVRRTRKAKKAASKADPLKLSHAVRAEGAVLLPAAVLWEMLMLQSGGGGDDADASGASSSDTVESSPSPLAALVRAFGASHLPPVVCPVTVVGNLVEGKAADLRITVQLPVLAAVPHLVAAMTATGTRIVTAGAVFAPTTVAAPAGSSAAAGVGAASDEKTAEPDEDTAAQALGAGSGGKASAAVLASAAAPALPAAAVRYFAGMSALPLTLSGPCSLGDPTGRLCGAPGRLCGAPGRLCGASGAPGAASILRAAAAPLVMVTGREGQPPSAAAAKTVEELVGAAVAAVGGAPGPGVGLTWLVRAADATPHAAAATAAVALVQAASSRAAAVAAAASRGDERALDALLLLDGSGRVQLPGAGLAAAGALAAARNARLLRDMWAAQLQRLLAAAVGRQAATLIAGPRSSYEEDELRPVLRSHLLAGGLAGGPPAVGGATAVELAGVGPSAALPWSAAAAAASRVLRAASPADALAAAATAAAAGGAAASVTAALALPLSSEDAFVASLLMLQADAPAAAEAAAAGDAGGRVLAWLQRQTPESALKRRAGVFPEVELPLLLAQCKHTGLLPELMLAATQLAAGSAGAGVAGDPPVSPAMLAVWRGVTGLRAHLRLQRVELKDRKPDAEPADKTAAEAAADAAADAAAAAASGSGMGASAATQRRLKPAVPKTFSELLAGARARAVFLLSLAPAGAANDNEEDEEGSGDAAGAEAGGGASASSSAASQLPHPSHPSLLTARSSSSSTAAAVEAGDLRVKWASVGLPSAALQLSRLTSSARGISGGAADADIVAALAVAAAGGVGSGLVTPPRTGRAPRLARLSSWKDVDGEEEAAAAALVAAGGAATGGADGTVPTSSSSAATATPGLVHADDVSAALADETGALASDSTARAVREYVKLGVGAPPELLSRLLQWRAARAAARAFGLAALSDFCRSVTLDRGVLQNALAVARPALRGVSERQSDAAAAIAAAVSSALDEGIDLSAPAPADGGGEAAGAAVEEEEEEEEAAGDDNSDGSGGGGGAAGLRRRRQLRRAAVEQLRKASGLDSDGSAFQTRHHYLAGLEGVSAGAADAVQEAHARLHAALAEALADSVGARDVSTASLILWTWGADVPPRDYGALLQTRLMHALGDLSSPAAVGVEHLDDGAVAGNASAQQLWRPWRLDAVRARLEVGSLSRFDLLRHVAAAPGPAAPTSSAADGDGSVGGDSPHAAGSGAAWLAQQLLASDPALGFASADELAAAGATALCSEAVLALYEAFVGGRRARIAGSGEEEEEDEAAAAAAATAAAAVTDGTAVDFGPLNLTVQPSPASVTAAVFGSGSALAAATAAARAAALAGGVLLHASGAALAVAGGDGAPADEAADPLGFDAQRRAAREPRVRSKLRHQSHSHPLAFSVARVGKYCSACYNYNQGKLNIACWSCRRCSDDVCEMCFAKRRGHERWEKMPVEKVSANFERGGQSTKEVPLSPAPSRAVWAEEDSVSFSAVPAALTDRKHRDFFRYICLPRKHGTKGADEEVLSFFATRPVRVWLGLPDAFAKHATAAKVPWLRNEYAEAPSLRVELSDGAGFTLWRGKRVALPKAAIPAAAAAKLAGVSEPDKVVLHGLALPEALSKKKVNLLLILEELNPEEVTYRDATGEEDPEVAAAREAAAVAAAAALAKAAAEAEAAGGPAIAAAVAEEVEASAAATAATSSVVVAAKLPPTVPPIRPVALLRQSAWALLQLLMLMGLGGSSIGAGAATATGSDGGDAAPAAAAAAAPTSATSPPPSLGPSVLRSASTVAKAQATPAAASRASDELEKLVFTLLRQQLQLSLATLRGSGPALPPQTTGAMQQPHARALEAAEAEAIALSALQFLVSVSDLTPVRRQLASPAFLQPLVGLFAHGAPRTQRLALRLLRFAASRLDPAEVDAALLRHCGAAAATEWAAVGQPRHDAAGPTAAAAAAGAGAGVGAGRVTLGWLLDLAASPSVAVAGLTPVAATGDDDEFAAADDRRSGSRRGGGAGSAASFGLQGAAASRGRAMQPLVFGAGNASQAVASEAVALGRTLLRLSGWRTLLAPALHAMVVAAPAVAAAAAAAAATDTCAAVRTLGALALLGGFVEPVRVGGRVLVTQLRLAASSFDEQSAGRAGKRGAAATAKAAGGAVEAASTAGGGGAFAGTLEATVVSYRLGDAALRVVYSADIAAVPVAVDVRNVVPAAEVAPSATVPAATAEAVAALQSLMGADAAAAASPLLASRLQCMAVHVLHSMLRSPAALQPALAGNVLDTLYGLALRPISLHSFVSAPALAAVYRALEARATEAASAAVGKATPSSPPHVLRGRLGSAASAQSVPGESSAAASTSAPASEPSAAATSTVAAADGIVLPDATPEHLRAAVALALDTAVHAGFAARALAACGGVAADARVWLQAHREYYGYPAQSQSPPEAVEVTLTADRGGDNGDASGRAAYSSFPPPAAGVFVAYFSVPLLSVEAAAADPDADDAAAAAKATSLPATQGVLRISLSVSDAAADTGGDAKDDEDEAKAKAEARWLKPTCVVASALVVVPQHTAESGGTVSAAARAAVEALLQAAPADLPVGAVRASGRFLTAAVGAWDAASRKLTLKAGSDDDDEEAKAGGLLEVAFDAGCGTGAMTLKRGVFTDGAVAGVDVPALAGSAAAAAAHHPLTAAGSAEPASRAAPRRRRLLGSDEKVADEDDGSDSESDSSAASSEKDESEVDSAASSAAVLTAVAELQLGVEPLAGPGSAADSDDEGAGGDGGDALLHDDAVLDGIPSSSSASGPSARRRPPARRSARRRSSEDSSDAGSDDSSSSDSSSSSDGGDGSAAAAALLLPDTDLIPASATGRAGAADEAPFKPRRGAGGGGGAGAGTAAGSTIAAAGRRAGYLPEEPVTLLALAGDKPRGSSSPPGSKGADKKTAASAADDEDTAPVSVALPRGTLVAVVPHGRLQPREQATPGLEGLPMGVVAATAPAGAAAVAVRFYDTESGAVFTRSVLGLHLRAVRSVYGVRIVGPSAGPAATAAPLAASLAALQAAAAETQRNLCIHSARHCLETLLVSHARIFIDAERDLAFAASASANAAAEADATGSVLPPPPGPAVRADSTGSVGPSAATPARLASQLPRFNLERAGGAHRLLALLRVVAACDPSTGIGRNVGAIIAAASEAGSEVQSSLDDDAAADDDDAGAAATGASGRGGATEESGAPDTAGGSGPAGASASGGGSGASASSASSALGMASLASLRVVIKHLLLEEKAAAEAAASGAGGSADGSTGLDSVFRAARSKLRHQGSGFAVAAAAAAVDSPEPSTAAIPAAGVGDSLSSTFVADCISNFVRSVATAKQPAAAAVAGAARADSLHPLPAEGVYTGRCSVPGAALVQLRFDARCGTGVGRLGEALSLYSDAAMAPESCIGTFAGPARPAAEESDSDAERPAPRLPRGVQPWPAEPLLVPGPTVYWRLSCGHGLPLGPLLARRAALKARREAARAARRLGRAAAASAAAPDSATSRAVAAADAEPSADEVVVTPDEEAAVAKGPATSKPSSASASAKGDDSDDSDSDASDDDGAGSDASTASDFIDKSHRLRRSSSSSSEPDAATSTSTASDFVHTSRRLRRSSSSSSEPDAATSTSAEWPCGACTYANAAAATECEMCGAARPAPAAPLARASSSEHRPQRRKAAAASASARASASPAAEVAEVVVATTVSKVSAAPRQGRVRPLGFEEPEDAAKACAASPKSVAEKAGADGDSDDDSVDRALFGHHVVTRGRGASDAGAESGGDGESDKGSVASKSTASDTVGVGGFFGDDDDLEGTEEEGRKPHRHPLSFFSGTPPGYSASPECDLCHGACAPNVWHCAACGYDECQACRDKTLVKGHPHPLVRIVGRPPVYRRDGIHFLCDLCRAEDPRPVWHCSACRYDECDACHKKASSSQSAAGADDNDDAQSAVLDAGRATANWGFSFTAVPVQGVWTQELNALTPDSASVGWACWLLDFLLNQVAAVLSRGAVHNQQMYDALTTFLRTRNTDAAIRAQVVQLLSQLLIHPHMFAALPDLSALAGLEAEVLGRASDLLGASSGSGSGGGGLKFLPPRLQALIELVVARHAAQAALETAERSGGGTVKGGAAAGAGGALAGAAATAAAASVPARAFPGDGVGVVLLRPALIAAAAAVACVEAQLGPARNKATRAAIVRNVQSNGFVDTLVSSLPGVPYGACAVFRADVAAAVGHKINLSRFDSMWRVVHGWEAAEVPPNSYLDLYDDAYWQYCVAHGNTEACKQLCPVDSDDEGEDDGGRRGRRGRKKDNKVSLEVVETGNAIAEFSMYHVARAAVAEQRREHGAPKRAARRRAADEAAGRTNRDGVAVLRGDGSHWYCGRRVGYFNGCGTCDGQCGPTNGCSCEACHALDVADGLAPYSHDYHYESDGNESHASDYDDMSVISGVAAQLEKGEPPLPPPLRLVKPWQRLPFRSYRAADAVSAESAPAPASPVVPAAPAALASMPPVSTACRHPDESSVAYLLVARPAEGALVLPAVVVAPPGSSSGGDEDGSLSRALRGLVPKAPKKARKKDSSDSSDDDGSSVGEYDAENSDAAVDAVVSALPLRVVDFVGTGAAAATPPAATPTGSVLLLCGFDARSAAHAAQLTSLMGAVEGPVVVVVPEPAAQLKAQHWRGELLGGDSSEEALKALRDAVRAAGAGAWDDLPDDGTADAAVAAPRTYPGRGSVCVAVSPASAALLADVPAFVAAEQAASEAAKASAAAASAAAAVAALLGAESAAVPDAIAAAAPVPPPTAVAPAAEGTAEGAPSPSPAAALTQPVLGVLNIAGVAARLAHARDMARLRMLQRGGGEGGGPASSAAAMATLAGSDLLHGGVASFGARPLKPALPAASATAKLIDRLLYVHELSAALHEGARPRDEILCAAWAAGVGCARYVESNHPYRPGEVLRGEVEVAGASELVVSFHPRCATAAGTELLITYTPKGAAPVTERFGGAAAPEAAFASAGDETKKKPAGSIVGSSDSESNSDGGEAPVVPASPRRSRGSSRSGGSRHRPGSLRSAGRPVAPRPRAVSTLVTPPPASAAATASSPATATAAAASPAGKPSPWSRRLTIRGASKLTYAFTAPAAVDAAAALWGVGFTVAPALSAGDKAALVARSGAEIAFASKQLLTGWTAGMDADLVDLARSVADGRGGGKAGPKEGDGSDSDDSEDSGSDGGKGKHQRSVMTLPLEALAVRSEMEALKYSSLADVPVPQLRMRLALIRLFNGVLQTTLPCFRLSSSSRHPWSVGSRLRLLSHCVLSEVKQGVLHAALKATKADESSIPTLYLSNFKSSESETRGDTAPESSSCMFVQAYLHLRSVPSAALRGFQDEEQSKVFEIQFEGESGIDAGGVYREGMSRILEDLFSERFSLLIKCPNARRGDRLNADSYVPNPALRSPLALSMLEFAGRLLGLSLRTKACLPFAFPSTVWKALAGERLTFDDLAQQDTPYAQFLDGLRRCDAPGVSGGAVRAAVTTDAEFSAAYPALRFVAVSADGSSEVELVPGGRELPVTLASRGRFVEAAERFRLREFDAQHAALRRGFANVVPLRALSLFTWQEVEILCAGKPDVDCAVLRAHTDYSGYSKDDAVVGYFWKALASFTGAERSNYLRFTWGRSRLPADNTWTSRHTISTGSGGDASLPCAHTCFCTIDLPRYSSEAILRQRLLTAVTYGLGGILNG